MNSVHVEGVYIGKAKNLGHGLISDIDKHRLDRRLWLWPQGLGTDEHGDPRFHTGPERALHHYPASTTNTGASITRTLTGAHRRLAKISLLTA